MKKSVKKQRTMFTAEEVKILLTLPNDNKKTGLRDKVLLSVVYTTGARAQEICDLTVGNVQFTQTGAALNITGKGGKTRRIGIASPCARMLKSYLKYRKIECKPDRHIFSSQTHEWMTVSCIEEIFKNTLVLHREGYPPG